MDWLYKRLTPSKRKVARWTELATAVETIWEEYFDPELSRLQRLQSAYEMDEADLNKKMREMGDSFTCDTPLVINKPLSLAWRRLELQSKDTEDIISSIFLRNFAHLPVTWFPIFAPIDQEYGSYFETYGGLSEDADKNVPPDGMWLTSRGVLGIGKLEMYQEGMVKSDLRTQAISLVESAKPLHIVFDGLLWYINFDLSFSAEANATWDTESQYFMFFTTVGNNFGIPRIGTDGETVLDMSTMSFSSKGIRQIAFPFVKEGAWRQHNFLPEGLGFRHVGLDGFLPLDLNIANVIAKTEIVNRLALFTLRSACKWSSALVHTHQNIEQERHEQESLPLELHVAGGFTFYREHQPTYNLPFWASTNEEDFEPFYKVFAENSCYYYSLSPCFSMRIGKHENQRIHSTITTKPVITSSHSLFLREWGLDMSQASIPTSAQPLLFDQIPADFVPLDTYGGIND